VLRRAGANRRVMAKSRKGRSPIPVGATAPRLAGLGRPISVTDLLQRAKPASDLESFLAGDPAADPKSQTPAPRGFP
jgi:hypothetical protein